MDHGWIIIPSELQIINTCEEELQCWPGDPFLSNHLIQRQIVKNRELIKLLEKFPDDANICIYEDNSYFQYAPIQSVSIISDLTGNSFHDAVKIGDVSLSAYEDF